MTITIHWQDDQGTGPCADDGPYIPDLACDPLRHYKPRSVWSHIEPHAALLRLMQRRQAPRKARRKRRLPAPGSHCRRPDRGARFAQAHPGKRTGWSLAPASPAAHRLAAWGYDDGEIPF